MSTEKRMSYMERLKADLTIAKELKDEDLVVWLEMRIEKHKMKKNEWAKNNRKRNV